MVVSPAHVLLFLSSYQLREVPQKLPFHILLPSATEAAVRSSIRTLYHTRHNLSLTYPWLASFSYFLVRWQFALSTIKHFSVCYLRQQLQVN